MMGNKETNAKYNEATVEAYRKVAEEVSKNKQLTDKRKDQSVQTGTKLSPRERKRCNTKQRRVTT